jgi:hypothetical protein
MKELQMSLKLDVSSKMSSLSIIMGMFGCLTRTLYWPRVGRTTGSRGRQDQRHLNSDTAGASINQAPSLPPEARRNLSFNTKASL